MKQSYIKKFIIIYFDVKIYSILIFSLEWISGLLILNKIWYIDKIWLLDNVQRFESKNSKHSHWFQFLSNNEGQNIFIT